MPNNHQKKAVQPGTNVKLGKKKPLVRQLLLVEGISRAGKFLVANLLHGFKGIEPVQYFGLLEHIPFLVKLGLIEKRIGQEILQCEIDTHCYEMLIGRNLNHRQTDKSSIFNIPSYKKYLKRYREPDGSEVVKRFYGEKLYSMFIVHELMSNIQIYFDTFPQVKVVSIQRSPVDLVYSWYSRGLEKRFGNDPILFNPPLQVDGKNIPWFAAGWGTQFLALSEMDRSIASIEWLVGASGVSYQKLSPCCKKKILHISYEGILQRTNEVIKKIGKFLGRLPMKNEMKIILERENLPNQKHSESKQEKLAFIKENSSLRYYNRLLALESHYNKYEKTL